MSTWESLPAEFNVATWFVDRNVALCRAQHTTANRASVTDCIADDKDGFP